jgi:hypothetical protein
VARACARSMAACASHMLLLLARGESGRSLTGAWGRVRPPMEAFPPPNGRSSILESGRGAIFSIGAGKPPFWASKGAAALERVNIVSDTFFRRVEARYFFDGGFSTVQR